MVKVRAFHSSDLGSNPDVCGLNLLLVLALPSRDFSPGTTVFPSPQKQDFFPNSNLIRNIPEKERLFFICECITTKSLFICLSILFAYLGTDH